MGELTTRMRGGTARALGLFVGVALALAVATGPTQAATEATFNWPDPVKCGPDGTLVFERGAKLVIFEPEVGRFEFTGNAKENSRRDEEYAVVLTFRDRSRSVLFYVVSEPFEMLKGRSSNFLVFGDDRQITRHFDAIAFVDLDTQVPFEPLFEDSFDFYRHLMEYARVQELEGRAFRR